MKLSALETYQKEQKMNDIDMETKKFCSFHGISIVKYNKGYRHSYDRFFTNPSNADTVIDARDRYYADSIYRSKVEFDVEEVVVVELPKRALTYMASIHDKFHGGVGEGAGRAARSVLERQYEESRIRKTVPAVQAAWEQYSLMLHLASNGLDKD